MIKVTTIDNPEYQEFENWEDFEETNQVLHSYDDKPSIIDYYEGGQTCQEQWYQNGKRHRDNNKPGYIRHNRDGSTYHKQWFLGGNFYWNHEYVEIMEQIKAMSDTEKLLDSRQWVREMVK